MNFPLRNCLTLPSEWNISAEYGSRGFPLHESSNDSSSIFWKIFELITQFECQEGLDGRSDWYLKEFYKRWVSVKNEKVPFIVNRKFIILPTLAPNGFSMQGRKGVHFLFGVSLPASSRPWVYRRACPPEWNPEIGRGVERFVFTWPQSIRSRWYTWWKDPAIASPSPGFWSS